MLRAGEIFEIFGEAAAAAEPAKCPLNDPSFESMTNPFAASERLTISSSTLTARFASAAVLAPLYPPSANRRCKNTNTRRTSLSRGKNRRGPGHRPV
jgi:hypothetical protein